MAIDAHANFGVSSVAVAPSPATTGTSLTVATGEGTRFPAVPFNATVAPSGVLATPANAEIVRVTARSGDVLTITRAQEGSVARAVVVGDLCVASITAKALQDIETGYARLDASNTFVTDQLFSGPNYGRVFIRDASQAADARNFQITNSVQELNIAAINDALNVGGSGLTLSRSGNVKVDANIYEKQRTTPIGHWIDVPFNAANFTANTGSWTVSSTYAQSYSLVGKTLHYILHLAGSSVSGSPNELRVAMPAGFVAAKYATAIPRMIDAGVRITDVYLEIVPSGSITIKKETGTFATSAQTTHVLFTFTFAIQ